MEDIKIIKKEEKREGNAQPQNNAEAEISWQGPEYEYRKKTADWFWSLGIIIIAFIVAAFLLKNFLLGIVAVLGGFSLALFAIRKPSTITFSITPSGIVAGDKIYSYEDLRGFCITSSQDAPGLLVEAKKAFISQIKIPLENADPEKIKACLSKHLKEEKIDESLLTILSRFLGL